MLKSKGCEKHKQKEFYFVAEARAGVNAKLLRSYNPINNNGEVGRQGTSLLF